MGVQGTFLEAEVRITISDGLKDKGKDKDRLS